MSRSPVELHCISQHPSGHSPALRHNYSHLTSIRESSSPVATNQALYKTALIPNTHCRGYKLFICFSTYLLDPRCAVDVFLQWTLRRGEIRTTNSSVYRASFSISDLLHLPVEVAISLFNKEALTLLILVCLSIQYVTEDQTIKKDFTTTMDILPSDPLTSILKVFQDGRPIEDYVEEFLNVSYRAPWKESTLKTIFWEGLDDFLYQLMLPSYSSWSLGHYIEYAIRLSYSPFTVDEVHDSPVDVHLNQPLPAAKSMVPQSMGKVTPPSAAPPLLPRFVTHPSPVPALSKDPPKSPLVLSSSPLSPLVMSSSPSSPLVPSSSAFPKCPKSQRSSTGPVNANSSQAPSSACSM